MIVSGNFLNPQPILNYKDYCRNLLKRAWGSYEYRFLILKVAALISASGVFITKNPFLALTATIVFCGSAFFYSKWRAKELLNERALNRNINLSIKQEFSWYNTIIEGKLTVGGIPLANYKHDIELREKGVTDWLSVVEIEEFGAKSKSIPVRFESKDHWLHISCADHNPLTVEELDKAADWINEKIKNQRHIYVHCKSGKGRSVITVIAYLMKYGNKNHPEINFGSNPKEIYSYIKTYLRKEINANDSQMAILSEYNTSINKILLKKV